MTEQLIKQACETERLEGIGEIARFSSQELEERSKDELEAKMEAYASCGELLHEAFTNAQHDFLAVRPLFEQACDKLAMVDEAAGLVLGREPDGSIKSLEKAFNFVEGIATFGTGMFTLRTLMLIKKMRDWGKAAGVLFTMNQHASEVGTVLKGATAHTRIQQGWASSVGLADDVVKIRRMAAGMGVLSIATAGLSVWLKIHTHEELKKYYREHIPTYADWYEQTRGDVIKLCVATKMMRGKVEELKQSLGIDAGEGTDAELLGVLNDALKRTGELEARIQAAERMLCSGMTPQEALMFSGLSEDTDEGMLAILVDRQSELLADDQALCRSRFPDLGV